VTGFPYLQIHTDDKGKDERAIKEVVYPVKRVVLDEPGLLEFTIRNPDETPDQVVATPADYYMLTEFVPGAKQAVFKDLITVVHPLNDVEKYMTNFHFNSFGEILSIQTKFPAIKPQLQNEYPDVKKIEFTFFMTLFGDSNVETLFQNCGMSTLFFLPHRKLNLTRTYDVEKIDSESLLGNVRFNFKRSEFKELLGETNKLIAFSYVKIRFIKSQNDANLLTLNDKMTVVPYFLMEIPARSSLLDRFASYGLMLLVFVLILLVLLCCKNCCFSSSKKNPRNAGYDAPGASHDPENSRFEMSAISRV